MASSSLSDEISLCLSNYVSSDVSTSDDSSLGMMLVDGDFDDVHWVELKRTPPRQLTDDLMAHPFDDNASTLSRDSLFGPIISAQ